MIRECVNTLAIINDRSSPSNYQQNRIKHKMGEVKCRSAKCPGCQMELCDLGHFSLGFYSHPSAMFEQTSLTLLKQSIEPWGGDKEEQNDEGGGGEGPMEMGMTHWHQSTHMSLSQHSTVTQRSSHAGPNGECRADDMYGHVRREAGVSRSRSSTLPLPCLPFHSS